MAQRLRSKTVKYFKKKKELKFLRDANKLISIIMSMGQYQLSWDSYKSNVCNGFTNLQQNEEFVDMTLAADGHLVKVHKSILALASPYIKSMLQTTPNNHPIIFLGNVSHEVLNYILTYVYTGEVSVGIENIQSFMKVAKDLRLSGLYSMPTPKVGLKENVNSLYKDIAEQNESIVSRSSDTEYPFEERITDNALLIESVNATEPTLTNSELLDVTASAKQLNDSNVKNVSREDMISNDTNMHLKPDVMTNKKMENNRDNGLYMTADGYQFKLEIQQPCNKHPDSTPITVKDTADKSSELMQVYNKINTAGTSINDDNDNFGSFEDEFKNKMGRSSVNLSSHSEAITLQYTMSNRGALQLILNRYMYYCHHQSHGGRKRRWRCIDYRSKQCPAFIDTDSEIMTSRKFGHPHSFHDEKIRKKMKRDLIFTNLNTLIEMQNKKIDNKVQT